MEKVKFRIGFDFDFDSHWLEKIYACLDLQEASTIKASCRAQTTQISLETLGNTLIGHREYYLTGIFAKLPYTKATLLFDCGIAVVWLIPLTVCYGADFTWFSKIICFCFGFALLRLAIGLKKTLTPFSHPIRRNNQKQSWLACARFLALCVRYMYLLLKFHCFPCGIDCTLHLWLHRVIDYFGLRFSTLDMKTALR